jgi:hypothetical protein
MASNIINISVGRANIQSGNGVPTHTASRGTLFIDVDTSNHYVNQDGGTTWILSGAGADTNDYTTGTTVVGNTVYFDRTDSLSAYTADLSSIGGESNTASNLTGGTGLFSGKSGTDLQFKSLTSTGATVTITDNGNTVNLESSGGGGSGLSNPVQENMDRNGITAILASSNTVYYNKFIAKFDMTLNDFGIFVSSASGSDTWYCGIYDDSNNLLASGSTTPSTAGFVTMSSNTALSITGGTEYWLAWKGTNGAANAGTTTTYTEVDNTQSQYYGSTGLPSTKSGTAASTGVYLFIKE